MPGGPALHRHFHEPVAGETLDPGFVEFNAEEAKRVRGETSQSHRHDARIVTVHDDRHADTQARQIDVHIEPHPRSHQHRRRQVTGDDLVDRRMAGEQDADAHQIGDEAAGLRIALVDPAVQPVDQCLRIAARYGRALPVGYIEEVSPAVAAADVEHLAALAGGDDLRLSLYRSRDGSLRFKFYRRDDDIRRQTAILGTAFERVILYEDQCQRGRADGEVLALLREGMAGASRTREVHEVQGELKAIDLALAALEKDELCLILVDQVDLALAHIASRVQPELEKMERCA